MSFCKYFLTKLGVGRTWKCKNEWVLSVTWLFVGDMSTGALLSTFLITPISSKLSLPFRHDSLSTTTRSTFGIVRCSRAAISAKDRGEYDPDLRSVLELATDSELYELKKILFGASYFSPLLKSMTSSSDLDYPMIEQDLEERENFIVALESRFLYLAADARSALRGWRPSYRNVLLAIRKKLEVPCSNKLSTEDLEAEIFLHLVKDYASEESGTFPGLWGTSKASNGQVSLELGLSQQKVQAFAALKLGVAELQSMILKGGGVFTLAKLYQLVGRKLTGKVFVEAANYQMKQELMKKGGQLAAINLESRAALLAAKQGLTGAASRYLGFRSIMSLLGPMMWGMFLADVVIQMLGTDYARILRAIYAFAQVFAYPHAYWKTHQSCLVCTHMHSFSLFVSSLFHSRHSSFPVLSCFCSCYRTQYDWIGVLNIGNRTMK
ncbi:hypothetical protein K2173_026377 [Erythroxylum novogranatense]|uniref:Uncharacterized protein n=1 Tax=Erythroxylum novogranatense TaxID=1862640 RepID=A0AAV8SN50_9ROSI|nr:hypothetical protein K2173_026377 [Erythroxylum novogranatense]